MFIVLRKKSIKQTLILGILLLLVGTSLLRPPVSNAMESIPIVDTTKYFASPYDYSKSEMNSMGIEKAGILSGIGKSTAYMIRQKTQWDMSVKQAYYRVQLAESKGLKPNPKDKALVEAEEKRKNPPKGGNKIGGNFLSDIFAYYTSGSKSKDDSSAKSILGTGITAAGLYMVLKVLAVAAI